MHRNCHHVFPSWNLCLLSHGDSSVRLGRNLDAHHVSQLLLEASGHYVSRNHPPVDVAHLCFVGLLAPASQGQEEEERCFGTKTTGPSRLDR